MCAKKVLLFPKSMTTLLKSYAEGSSIHGTTIRYIHHFDAMACLKSQIFCFGTWKLFSSVVFLQRSSVSVQQTRCHSTDMVYPGAACPGWRHHLRLERVLGLAGRAHHHQPEDHLQARQPAWLSFGDNLQGRAELASCERGFGKGGRRMGEGEKGKEISFGVIRVQLLPAHIPQDMWPGVNQDLINIDDSFYLKLAEVI